MEDGGDSEEETPIGAFEWPMDNLSRMPRLEDQTNVYKNKKRPIAPQTISPRTNGKKKAACASSCIYIWEPAFFLAYDRLIVDCLEAFATGMEASRMSGI